MKSIYKIFLLALGVYLSAFAQITEITRLPVQDISQSIKEFVPIWHSTNGIIIFYLNETRDTIFSTKSNDRGLKWSQPKVVTVVNIPLSQEQAYLTGIKSSSGRLFLAWSVFGESMKLIYSDDQGNNWSQPISILGAGTPSALQKSSRNLNLTQWNTNEICLSFTNSNSSKAYFKLSSDDGITWSVNPSDFPEQENYRLNHISINSVNDNLLLAVYEKSQAFYSGIYSRMSSNYGLNWSPEQIIADEIYHERRPKVTILENENVVIAYLRDNINQATKYGNYDIFYRTSFDLGSTWSTETRFTKYSGQDVYINLSSFQNKAFISFATERFSIFRQNEFNTQIAYGILGETVEQFTPPIIYNTNVPTELIDYSKREFVYRATVVDDEAVQSVTASMEGSIYTAEMFDDGLHYDGAANDSVFANTFPFIQERYLEGYSLYVNKIDLPLNNKGILADVNVAFGQKGSILANDLEDNQAAYEGNIYLGNYGSQGKYEEGAFLFSAGFFLSGYVNGNLFANGVASASLFQDYQPGNVGSDPDNPLNVLYVVHKNDPLFGTSWQRWKDAVSLGADFYDGNGDGIYSPIDKNYNGTWDPTEDMPPLLGDEIVWCVYNDGVPADQRRYEVEPIGIEIQQTLFATSDPELENVIFIKYKVTNTGLVSEVLDSIFFSPWDDTDLGDHNDDLGGCDTLLQSVFTYNYLNDMVYGNNPPAIFTTVLQGPIVESFNTSDTAYIRNGVIIGEEIYPGSKNLGLFSFTGYAKGDPDQGDPGSINHIWNYVHARDKLGNLLNPCDTGYGKVYGNINCNDVNPIFWFSGDPVTKQGWLDKQARDDRKFSSIGPLSLKKNKPVEIILALVVGRGTDPLNSISVARENVQRVIQEYQSNFASMTYSAPPPTNPVSSYVLYQNYPNPFNPTTTIRYELPQDGVVTIDIYDILGQKVKTVVNEFQKADRYEVKFSATGIASGVYIYQLRVNDFISSKKMVLIR